MEKGPETVRQKSRLCRRGLGVSEALWRNLHGLIHVAAFLLQCRLWLGSIFLGAEEVP